MSFWRRQESIPLTPFPLYPRFCGNTEAIVERGVEEGHSSVKRA
jgi:hypothetical protein